MAEIYGGHIVAKHLKTVEGIDTVFSLSGGHIDKIYNGLLDYQVRLIDVRHEQAAVMMAHSWSLYRSQPGVCIITAGPGFTNAITGIVNAHLENAPLVVINGTAPIRDWKKGALQDICQSDLIKSSVKWTAVCHDIKRIPEYLAEAFRHAVSGRPGPVFLELPPDILGRKINEEQVIPARSGCILYRCRPESRQLQKAAELLNSARNPLLIGGSGCRNYSAELRRFIDKSGVPFLLLNAGRGAVSDDNPLSLWDGGMMSMMVALPMADVVIALGIRFDWLLSFGEGFPGAKTIRVDIEPTEIDRNRIADVGLFGDIGLTLAELEPLVRQSDHSAWRQSLKDIYLPLVQEEYAIADRPSTPIHPARLVKQVRETIGSDAIYFVDGGDTSYFGLTGLSATEPSSVIASAGGLFGCLGTGIPFAVGAKAARPDKTVVVINGDGSFGFNNMEFHTAVRHQLPFICVINNDQAWGMIKHGQEIAYGADRVTGSELGVVHYEKLVEALGGHGELVTRDEQIVPAIRRAMESGRPACINVITDPTAVSPATLLLTEALKME